MLHHEWKWTYFSFSLRSELKLLHSLSIKLQTSQTYALKILELEKLLETQYFLS